MSIDPKLIPIHNWKKRVLDSKSSSFCGAKWYHASMWLGAGTTTSCHHNPAHMIDIEAIKNNPSALHNTDIKKQERLMMQKGERPINCQFCWVMEDLDSTTISDRAWQSTGSSEEKLNYAFTQPHDIDVDPEYLEVSFESTCQMACSYCGPSISTSWGKDIKQFGIYKNLPTDTRKHYEHDGNDWKIFDKIENPYAEAWMKWWEQSLHKNLKQLRITGGEPMMSGYTWKLLEWLANNPSRSRARIEITTNLSYSDKMLNKLFEHVEKIKQPVWIYTSGESIGAKNEYIRDGLDWELWLKNLRAVEESGLFQNVSICGTLGALSTDGLLDFLKFVLEEKIRKNQKSWLTTSLNIVRFPIFQNMIVLPIELRLEYANELDAFLKSGYTKKYFTEFEHSHLDRYIKYLRGVLEPLKESKADIKALQKDFKSFFTQYDARRNKNLVETFPRLADWYNSID